MRVDNLQWHPVRLGMRRVRPNAWWLSRKGHVVGEVRRDSEGWIAKQGSEGETDDGRKVLILGRFWEQRHQSFIAAALSVTRLEGVWASSDGPQDFGDVRMLRLNVASQWYTVLLKGDDRYIYQDFTIPDKLTDEGQAIVRRVLSEVDKKMGGAP